MKNIAIFPIISQKTPAPFRNCMDCKSSCWKTIKRCLQIESGFFDPSQINPITGDFTIYQSDDDLTIDTSEIFGRVCQTCAKVATEAFKVKRGMSSSS